ncbi:hypothetical protein [Streptomyces profundus]|uniref:hypothetical protein n=1 Tax=Streptomyces profundus TaxID=2867410 RepID=UPI001D16301D|nr:hypothetical protein [Streptomyces sp. MA3_2.13]UED86750.1 hypothetical protein K4G22_23245 [Streptomyces sp. MA3_2.13]
MRKHTRALGIAAVTATLLALTGCGDDDAEPTRAVDSSDQPADEAPTDEPADTDEPATDDDDGEEPGGASLPGDLAFGDTHNWNDDTSVTVAGVTEVPLDQLSEFDVEFLTEGHTPVAVEVAIHNEGDVPLDLAEFAFFVRGATTGGEADSLFLDGDEFLEGRLAPGQTRDHIEHVSFDVGAYGADITVETMRFYEGMDFDNPVWAGTIGSTA